MFVGGPAGPKMKLIGFNSESSGVFAEVALLALRARGLGHVGLNLTRRTKLAPSGTAQGRKMAGITRHTGACRVQSSGTRLAWGARFHARVRLHCAGGTTAALGRARRFTKGTSVAGLALHTAVDRIGASRALLAS